MTPKEQGFFFPAEFAKHTATWLSWPHKEASWPGKIETIYPVYAQFIKLVSEGQRVNINVVDEAMKQKALRHIVEAGTDVSKVNFFIHPTNDAWCRDHGPAFVINPQAQQKKIIID
ncbi:MAG TPA: agmatine deiminase family protein, partial [Cyclobacteriaceae bacterium]|nr:agmatine deiminase family protein [Cyclobacteriaceae bacterium]